MFHINWHLLSSIFTHFHNSMEDIKHPTYSLNLLLAKTHIISPPTTTHHEKSGLSRSCFPCLPSNPLLVETLLPFLELFYPTAPITKAQCHQKPQLQQLPKASRQPGSSRPHHLHALLRHICGAHVHEALSIYMTSPETKGHLPTPRNAPISLLN